MGCNHSIEAAAKPAPESAATCETGSGLSKGDGATEPLSPTSSSEGSDSKDTTCSSPSKHEGVEEPESPGSSSEEREPKDKTVSTSKKPKLVHSVSSAVEQVNEIRKEEGDLKTNVVHLEVPFGKPIEEVYDGVHSGPILGSGISGEVRLITHKATGIKYAVKCLDLGQVKTHTQEALREEILAMSQLDHPNIVRLEEVYESHSEIYLVQELCLGGDLFDRLDEQPDYHYSETQCARLVKQMLDAVRYIHSKGIIHRDLKLENFLFSSTKPDSELKLIDFGLSKHFKFGEVHTEAVGTPYTIAPEIIQGSYDEKCDVWAIGVLAYLLLSGNSPFGGCGEEGQNMRIVRKRILTADFHFKPGYVWSAVSSSACDFIRLLLTTNSQKRPTAEEAQQHRWLAECCNRGKPGENNGLNPDVVKALVSFKEFSDMHKLLYEVLSFTLLPEQIGDLRKEFEKIDKDGSGEISLCALKQVLVENAGSGSLGALTEAEVEDIFNAMRVRKSEQRIQWHEFIAAGITQCQVDERNLRLAFDRLDSDHKGFVTFENIMDLVGNDDYTSEGAMRDMWGESMRAVNCKHARITYEDFLLLMKGQCCGESPRSNRKTIPSPKADRRIAVPPRLPEGEPVTLPHRFVTPETKSGTVEYQADSRRVLLLPEHNPDESKIDDLINDETKSPLVVNRTLYRAHRQMRLAVLEASKRFEEDQARRARETLLSQHQGSGNEGAIGAALVMRHHIDTKQISSEAVERFLTQSRNDQKALIETASSRGGRRRMKSVSDMTCLLMAPNVDNSSLLPGSMRNLNALLPEHRKSDSLGRSTPTSCSLGELPAARIFGSLEGVFSLSEVEHRPQ